MPIITPGRRPAYPPIGKLRAATGGGKKNGFVSLNLTAMVDMFTILVIFLIQLFSADSVTVAYGIRVPEAVNAEKLQQAGTQVIISADQDLATEGWQGNVTVEKITIDQDKMGAPTDILMPGVAERLVKLREEAEALQAATGTARDREKPYDGVLTVQADVKTDFKVIRRVLFSANDAGWAKIKFVALPISRTVDVVPSAGVAPAGE